MRGCTTIEVKKGEIGKMFLRRRFDVCALSKTKLKGKGEVVGRVFGVAGGRARPTTGHPGPLGGPVTEWVVDEVCSRMEGGVIQAYVR